MTIYDVPERDRLTIEQQTALSLWIHERISPRRAVDWLRNSYHLKHVAEYELKFYIHNEEFKAAMIRAGYNPQPPEALNPNYKIALLKGKNHARKKRY